MPVDLVGDTAQTKLAAWMAPFTAVFTAPTRQHVLVLIVGAILSPGRRAAAALRAVGLDQDPRFTNYHRVLNRNRWSSLRLARCLCRLLAAVKKRVIPARLLCGIAAVSQVSSKL